MLTSTCQTDRVPNRLDDFILLLCSQSISREQRYWIRSSGVRKRMVKLQAANDNMGREQAFMKAVLEEGTKC